MTEPDVNKHYPAAVAGAHSGGGVLVPWVDWRERIGAEPAGGWRG